MGRTATLKPSYLKGESLWYLSVPPVLSRTGKRAQEYFPSKEKAEAKARELGKPRTAPNPAAANPSATTWTTQPSKPTNNITGMTGQ